MPVMSVYVCPVANEGTGVQTSACSMNSALIVSYAEFAYGLLLISAFTMFVPMLIYVALVFVFAAVVMWIMRRVLLGRDEAA